MKLSIVIVFISLILKITAYAQYGNGNGDANGFTGAFITGKVTDDVNNSPVEYANIIIKKSGDSLILTGGITDSKGNFRLSKIPPGNYSVEIRFVGYKTKRLSAEIKSSEQVLELGNIPIHASEVQMQDVIVQGERNPVTYQIDKKVVDVSKMETAASGNAADVLQNVPSVTVDIEGNVSLRGSTNFTVLVDGRPSVMNAQDILQQIPASSMEKIEIITNPSAKYDPEGTSGIINILLKKNQNLGLSGVINTNAGTFNNFGGDFLFQYKTEDITYIFGGDYNKRMFPGTSNMENRFISNNITSFLYSSGTGEWGRTSFGARTGVEFKVFGDGIISAGLRYNYREGGRKYNQTYLEWTSINTAQKDFSNYSRFERNGNSGMFNLSFFKKFNNKGHELRADFNLSYDDDKGKSTAEKYLQSLITSGKITEERGPEKEFEGKIDYVLPVFETGKIETGYDGQLDLSEEESLFYEFNSVTGNYDFIKQFSNTFKYNVSNHAVYAIYSDNLGNFGYKAGVRGELTYRNIEAVDSGKSSKLNASDLFPSLHFSYKAGEITQFMASYTRRIQRPQGRELEPTLTWIDANNVRQGNPDLLPQYIDSYETGVQTGIGPLSISADIYYRNTRNRIEQIKSVYQQNVSLNSIKNVGSDRSIGTELMFLVDPFRFWNINLMLNMYDFKVEGEYNNQKFERTSFNWGTRFNNIFRLGQNTSLQFNINYNSPTVSSQGRMEGFFSTDVSARQDFFEKKITLTLQVRDIFGTAKFESTSQGVDFYNYSYMKRQAPVVMLNLRYNFNNFQQKRDKNTRDMMNGRDSEEF